MKRKPKVDPSLLESVRELLSEPRAEGTGNSRSFLRVRDGSIGCIQADECTHTPCRCKQAWGILE